MRLEENEQELVVINENLRNLASIQTQQALLLNVSFNHINNLKGIENAKNIRILNLMHNEISCMQPVSRLLSLQVLKCSHNQITELAWISPLVNLREVWLNNNKINTEEVYQLESLTSMKILIIHPNPCTKVPSHRNRIAEMLPNLVWLDNLIVDRSKITKMSDGEHISQQLSKKNGLLCSKKNMVDQCDKQSSKNECTALRKKRTTVEEMLKSFPIQENITLCEDINHKSDNSPIYRETEASNVETSLSASSFDLHTVKQSDVHTIPLEVSSISTAVLSLPTFTGGLLTTTPNSKNYTLAHSSTKSVKSRKGEESKNKYVVDISDKRQEELIITYPGTMISAITVRPDAAAVAKWPNGNIALSVDKERMGYRIYAAHKDGQVALSFDSEGVGFINYYPSGKTMISTTSGGDGMLFSADGTILRMWDVSLNVTDFNSKSVESGMNDKSQISHKFNENLGFILSLSENGSPSKIHLKVFFSCNGVRHVFQNSANISQQNGDECEILFGKEPPKSKIKIARSQLPHSELLLGIRKAVANLH